MPESPTPNRADLTLTTPPTIVTADEHGISAEDISPRAIKVVTRLTEAGFQAYLVGGCIRDLLLGNKPKDFDVATDAKPEEVHSLFKNARLIGRRFRIVHVYFGREIIEVTTFRGNHDEQTVLDKPDRKNLRGVKAAASEAGMLLRDNIYGTAEEDAVRRDFSVNALYYDCNTGTILDYCGGLNDLHDKTLRILGEPETRYQEDPVRMLRAIRFAAKLDFTIASKSADCIPELAALLANVAPARLFDEALKLFMSGNGLATFQLLEKYQLFEQLFPASAEALAHSPKRAAEQYHQLIEQALANTDKRIADNKPVTPAFIFAAFLWPAMRHHMLSLEKSGIPERLAMQQASQDSVLRQVGRIAIPKRFTMPMREIWSLQWRFEHRSRKRIESLLSNRRFRAAYDFLVLRANTGEADKALADWWTRYQEADEQQQTALIDEAPKPPRKRRRYQRR